VMRGIRKIIEQADPETQAKVEIYKEVINI
jgi:hypothetical protein